jgi:hypothetical protein
MDTDREIATFLAQAEPDNRSNRFVIGGFESGITLYKQQVRALNLIYSIHQEKRIARGAKIAVIGGGVSGVTAATAASALGYEVYLFERRPVLLHLQHGCDTRWVHPHVYDWPAYGTERPYAGLPILDWRESTAGGVVEQIQRNYEQIKKKTRAGKIHEHTGATVSISKKNARRVSWSDSFGTPKNGESAFAAVIFAVGFGVERQVESGAAVSYWRNDSVNQLKPGPSVGDKTVYLVSGTGDGGLIDLLRTRIQSFNQGRIIGEMITSSKEASLLSALRGIDEEWRDRNPSGDDTWLFDQYTGLDEQKLLDPLKKRLTARLRKDTEASLNGREETLSQAIRLDRASLFNTLMTHVLFSLGEFRYVGGECKLGEGGIPVINGREEKAHHIIVRHGTDQEAVFAAIDFNEGVRVMAASKKQDSIRQRLDTSRSLWPAGWWTEHAKNVLSGVRQEFVPPATRAIATTFVSTLSDIIGQYKKSKSARFRITLHRLTKINEEEFFQQISQYAGTKTSGAVGRVFDVQIGLVGLVCRMGQPIIVKREEDFDELWQYLELNSDSSAARPVDPNVKSLLACPFFAPIESGVKPKHISLVLFMDSEQKEFFTLQVLNTVYAACKGFVQNLEAMKSKEDVIFASSDYSGYAYTRNRRPDEASAVKKYKSVKTENEVFGNFIEDLTFRTVSYFDAYLR